MISEKDNSGPALPVFPETGAGHGAAFRGMSLRDYFAAKAMQGEIAAMSNLEAEICGIALDADDKTLDRLATHYYRIADAMLKAREA